MIFIADSSRMRHSSQCSEYVTKAVECVQTASEIVTLVGVGSVALNFGSQLESFIGIKARLLITAAGAVSACVCNRVVEKLENSRVLRLTEQQNIAASLHFSALQRTTNTFLEEKDLLEPINKIYATLFTGRMQGIKHELTDAKITFTVELYEKCKIAAVQDRTSIYMPRTVIFSLKKNGEITFPDQASAPYEKKIHMIALKSTMIWWEVSFAQKKAELTCRHIFGLVRPSIVATPVVRIIKNTKGEEDKV